MKTINALVVLGIASLLSACGGSGSGSGASSSSVSSLVVSVSSPSSAVSVDASSADASSSSVATSVADANSSSPAISSADVVSSSSLAVSSVDVSPAPIISSADASSSSLAASSIIASSSGLAASSIVASSSSLAISSSSVEASSSSLVSSSSAMIASSSSLAASSASAALYPSYNTNPIAADMAGMDSNATQLAAKIKLGINVGNQMEATGCTPAAETCWGHPKVSKAYVKLVKDSGFDAIRLPVSWDQYANQTTGKISDVWLNRVKEVVQYAVDNGLYVMVNIHWDGGWLERSFHEAAESETKKEAVKAKQKAYWEQIATHLRDFDERVMFASANEPDTSNDNESASVIASRVAVLDEYHQTFVDAVRSTGGKNAYRVLIIQAPRTDIDLAANHWFVMPSDTATGRQMAEVHFYPFSFTNQDKDIVADWGTLQMFCYWGKGHHSTTHTYRNSTREEEDFVDAKFAQMKTKFADQGIPVVLGEFAARPRSEEICTDYPMHLASRAYYAQYVTQAALENGMLPFFWDTGEVFNRGTPAVNNQQTLDGLLIGAGKKNGSSSSSQSSSVNSSSVSSSSSSSANNMVLDTSPSKWDAKSGAVKNESATHMQFTLSASGQAAETVFAAPINMNGSTVEVVLNFDQAFVTDRENGNVNMFQFFALDGDWGDVGGQQWVCMKGSTPIVADQDQAFTCSGAFNDVPDVIVFGLQFFATAGTVTIKSATIQLAE